MANVNKAANCMSQDCQLTTVDAQMTLHSQHHSGIESCGQIIYNYGN